MISQPAMIRAQITPSDAARAVLAVGVYLCAADYLVARVMKMEPVIRESLGIHSIGFFYFLAIFLFGLKVAGLMTRFGSGRIVADVLEICFYDLLTLILGLALFAAGLNTLPAKVLNYGFFVVLVIRLCWHFRAADGESAASWPVFGLIGVLGLVLKKREQRAPVAGWHDHLVYSLILLCPVFGFGLVQLGNEDFGTVVAVVALVFLLLQAPFFMVAKVPQEPAPQVAAKPAAMPSVPSPMPGGQGGTGGAIDLDPEEQKLIQLYRGMAAEKRPRVLNAMVALKKTFDKHEPGQAPGD